MTTPKSHFVRVTAEVHHRVRIAAANLSAQTDRSVPQSEAISAALAVAERHPDEVRAELGVTT
jgi:hypothetical protein